MKDFNLKYGTDVNNAKSWRNLCEAMALPVQNKLEDECKVSVGPYALRHIDKGI